MEIKKEHPMEANDYEGLWKRAKSYGERQGLGDEAEDFAQEAILKLFGGRKATIKQLFIDYYHHLRADKRVLSSPYGKLSAYARISLDCPLDENGSQATLSDVIGSFRDEFTQQRSLMEFENLFRQITRLAKNPLAQF